MQNIVSKFLLLTLAPNLSHTHTYTFECVALFDGLCIHTHLIDLIALLSAHSRDINTQIHQVRD